MNKNIFIFCFLSFIFLPLFAAEKDSPEPYGPDQFFGWQEDLRRAEILSFGSLPFVTFFSSIYYDVWRYYDNDQEKGYLPWPLKNSSTAVPLTEREQKNILYTSIGVSLGVALVDFIWQTVKRSRRKTQTLQRSRSFNDPIIIEPVYRENYETILPEIPPNEGE